MGNKLEDDTCHMGSMPACVYRIGVTLRIVEEIDVTSICEWFPSEVAIRPSPMFENIRMPAIDAAVEHGNPWPWIKIVPFLWENPSYPIVKPLKPLICLTVAGSCQQKLWEPFKTSSYSRLV